MALIRRDALKLLGAGALTASTRAWGQTPASSPAILMDGHVHAINRVYWEEVDTLTSG